MQFGEVCGGDVLGLHNLTVATLHSAPVTPPPGTSFVNGVMVWFVSYAPVDVSFTMVSAGATTVTVMVELTTRSRLSST